MAKKKKKKTTGEIVLEKRIELEMTRVGLAREAGVSRQTVAAVESDWPVTMTTMTKIAEALGCETKELMP